jgi:hypothetical protein
MSCCGQKRRALSDARQNHLKPPPPAPPVLQNPQLVSHTGKISLVIRGPVTGQVYLFGGGGMALTVDERDVPALLETGRFAVSAQLGRGEAARPRHS